MTTMVQTIEESTISIGKQKENMGCYGLKANSHRYSQRFGLLNIRKCHLGADRSNVLEFGSLYMTKEVIRNYGFIPYTDQRVSISI